MVFLKVPILLIFPTVPTLYCTIAVMCIAYIHPTHISQNNPLFKTYATVISMKMKKDVGFTDYYISFSQPAVPRMETPIYKCSFLTGNPSL